jgi:hypothetical protein
MEAVAVVEIPVLVIRSVAVDVLAVVMGRSL